MIPQHKHLFFTVADHLNCYIGLREPNADSDQWITKEGSIPKGVDVKAKTAKAGKFAGLVVNPNLLPEAFPKKDDLERAKKSWNDFTKHGLPGGFSFETSGPEKGVLKKHGSAIHADYDLMLVTLADEQGNMKFTSSAEAEMLFLKVENEINRMIPRKKMIQHATEFQYNGVGAPPTEQIYIFGPKRKFMISTSSFKYSENKEERQKIMQ
jgi:hypothetical protein